MPYPMPHDVPAQNGSSKEDEPTPDVENSASNLKRPQDMEKVPVSLNRPLDPARTAPIV